MPGLQSIVKAWTKINHDHVEYVDDDKNKRSGESSSSIAFADTQLPRRPSASSSSSTGGGGDIRRRKIGRRGQAWISDQGSNYADSSSDNASVSVSASASSIGGIAKLFHEADISGKSSALANEEGGDGRGSAIGDQPTSTQKFTPSLLINSTQEADLTLHQNRQQQQQHHPQQYQHQETMVFSTQQRHFQKSPPPTLPTPSSYLANNLSSHTFSVTDGNDGMFDISDVSTKLRLNDDINRNQLSKRSHMHNQHQNIINNSRNADDRRKSAGDVLLGRRRPSNSTAPATAAVDATLSQLHQQEHQLYRTIMSGGGISIGDNISNSITPLTTNKAYFPPPTHHSGVTNSSSQKQTTPKPLNFPFDKDQHTGPSQFTPGNELRRRGISRQQQQIKEDLERHQTPEEILSRIQAQNSKDEGQQRHGRSSNLLELFLLEEEEQQLDTSASNLIVPANEGDEDVDPHEEGEPSNMRSYHRRRYVMGGPLRGQEHLSIRSRDAHTRSKPQTEDQWMQEWLTHTNRNATTSSMRGAKDQPQKRNSLSSSSSGTTVTANRSFSIRDVNDSSIVTMKMPSQSTAATETNKKSEINEHPTPNIESNTSVPSQDGRISTASSHHCNRCAQMESALLALHADLEYLRSLELQREFVDTGTRDDNGQATSTSLHPINKTNVLNLDVNNVISATPSSSQSISSAVTMGSRGSLASSRFGSITRSRQQQQRQQQQQLLQLQHQHPQQYQKRNSSLSQVNAYMTLRDASKRLTDLSTRHQRQVKQSMHDCAYWQNDMHLKLEKFALMCKNLNEEAACRGNEVKETRALLDKITSERNALASEAVLLRAQIEVYEKECAEQSSLREEWEQERIKMSKKELEIKVRDEIIDDMSKRLELAVETIESERKLQTMRRSIIFPPSRPQPSSPSTLQHKLTDADSGVCKQTTPLDSVSKVFDFYSEELKKSKEILQTSMVQSASREKELQFRLGIMERELIMARQGASAGRMSTDQEQDVKDSLWYRPSRRRRRSL